MYNKANLVYQWNEIYENYFNIRLDFADDLSDFKIDSNYDPKKHWGVIVSHEISLHDVLGVIENEYGIEVEAGYYPNATFSSDWSFLKDQKPRSNYCIFLNKSSLPPTRLNGDSFHDWLVKDSPNGRMHFAKSINLLERLLLEIYYHEDTGYHLDVDTDCANTTVCVSPTFKNNKHVIYPAVGCDKNGSIYIAQYNGAIGRRDQGIIDDRDYSSFNSGNGCRRVLSVSGQRDCFM